MSTPKTLGIADGLGLPEEIRALLRADQPVAGAERTGLRYPRYFYVLESWQHARETRLTAHFTLSELMSVDCREANLLLHKFPHYVPCAVSVLARYLEEFRTRVEAPVMVRVNGGYRSPSHKHSASTSPHCWGAAVDIYRIGDAWLDSQKSIERYAAVAVNIGQEMCAKPYGHRRGETDDHLHLDLGYLHLVPKLPPNALSHPRR